jgi:hypothetical protein
MAYQCKICKLKYSNEKLAKECEAWCSTHDSCNFMIAKQAINKDEAQSMAIEDDERFKYKQSE